MYWYSERYFDLYFARKNTSIIPIFKLSELTKRYESRLAELESHHPESCGLNSTKLKDRLISQRPDLSAEKSGCGCDFCLSIVLVEYSRIHLRRIMTELLHYSPKLFRLFELEHLTQGVSFQALLNQYVNGEQFRYHFML